MTYRGWEKDDVRAETIYQRYLEKMRAFITWLIDTGNEVRLLTGGTADTEAVSDLLRLFGDGASTPQLAVGASGSLEELMGEIARTDVVVATRYHNVVCALKMARPTISLGYAAKNDVLLRRTGLGEYCHHVETFDVEVLKRQFGEMVENRVFLARGIRRTIENFRADLAQQDRLLKARIGIVSHDEFVSK